MNRLIGAHTVASMVKEYHVVLITFDKINRGY